MKRLLIIPLLILSLTSSGQTLIQKRIGPTGNSSTLVQKKSGVNYNILLPPDLPTSISGLTIWWNADSITSSGGYAESLKDLSGNGYNATYSNVNYRPAVLSNNLNSHNALNFDGSDDFLYSDNPTISQPFTIILLGIRTSYRNGGALAGGTLSAYCTLMTYNNKWSIYGGVYGLISDTMGMNKLNYYIAEFNTTKSSLATNDVDLPTNISIGTNSLKGLTIGSYAKNASVTIGLKFYQVLVYNKRLSGEEKAKLLYYLQYTYGQDWGFYKSYPNSHFDKIDYASVKLYDSTTYIGRSAYSQYRFTTDATSLLVKGYADINTYNYSYLTIRVADTVYGRTAVLGYDERIIRLPKGLKNVAILDGAQGNNGVRQTGSWVQNIYFPNSINYIKIPNNTPASRIVFIGNSVTIGQASTFIDAQGYAQLFSTLGKKDVAYYAWGGATLVNGTLNMANTATSVDTTSKRVARLLSGVTDKKICIEIGTNDYTASVDSSIFAGKYAILLDSLHSKIPTAIIYCVTPLYRNGETILMDGYRRGIEAACLARSSYAIYVNSKLWLTYPTDFAPGDVLHPSTDGHLKFYNLLYPIIYP